MKKKIAILGLLFYCNCGYSQKIQYSRSIFRVDDPRETQLVSNINGFHHMLTFEYNRKPSICVFGPELQIREKKQLDFTIKRECDVKLISFPGHYLVYIHFFKPSIDELWRVDKDGNSERLTKQFGQVVDSFFTSYNSVLQLFNIDDSLYLTGIRYYDTIKTARTTVIKLDDQLRPLHTVNLFYPLDGDNELLRQTALTKNAFFILKSLANDQEGNRLDILKIDLDSGKMVANYYKAGPNVFVNPRFVLNEKDSSVLIYSMIMGDKFGRATFINRLNSELQEQDTLTVLKSQFRQNTISNFLLLNGQQSSWLHLMGMRRFQRIVYSENVIRNPGRVNTQFYSYDNSYNLNYNQPAGVRFTVLDKQFNVRRDSLVANDKKIIEVQPSPFGQFVKNDKGYLVLIQNFAPRRKGLLLISADSLHNFTVTPLPVYDRWDYQLDQLQFNKNYFIVPYYRKNEMGLMKITMPESATD